MSIKTLLLEQQKDQLRTRIKYPGLKWPSQEIAAIYEIQIPEVIYYEQ